MENQARAANTRLSGIPKPGNAKPAAVVTANSADAGIKAKPRTSPPAPFEASGPGLLICAPKVATSFAVNGTSTAAKKLKASELKVAIKGAAPVKPEARASETLSQIDLQGSSGFAGEPYTARLVCFDQFGVRFSGRTDVSASVLDGETVLFEAGAVDMGEGVFEVTFRPQISGTYGLAVQFDGSRALQGSPFPIKVRNDETIAANCKLYGSGLTQAVAGQRTSFTIQAVDGKQNARIVGGDKFEVEVSGPSTSPPKTLVKDNMDGTYEVFWMAETAGMYLITAKLDGASVGGCPVSCTVRPTDLDACRCTASGPGLSKSRAGQPAIFHITAADRFGNQRSSGGDSFEVSVAQTDAGGRAVVAGKVEDTGQGAYRVQYAVNFAGTYRVAVTAAGEVDPQSSRLYGPGLAAVQLGRPSQIYVELADRYGNKASAGALDAVGVKVHVAGPGPTPVTAGGVTNGVCAFTYFAQDAGTFAISATVGSVHMRGSPASVVASIAEAHALLCEVKGAPLTLSTEAGQAAGFMLIAKDAQGVQKSLGGDKFTVQWSLIGDAAPPITGKVEDLGNGEYKSSFSATAAGSYSVSVMHEGSNIAGSPFTANVAPAAISPARCYVDGSGISAARAGHKPLAASWDPKAASELAATDVSSGPRRGSSSMAGLGRDTVTVEVDSPCEAVFQVPVLDLGEHLRVAVAARDAFGNRLQHGGAVVQAELRRPSGVGAATAAEVADCGDGSYHVTCSMQAAGDFQVAACIAGQPGSTITLAGSCLPASTSAQQCSIAHPPGAITAGTQGRFKVWRADAFANRLTCSGNEPALLASAVGPGDMRVEATECGDGSVDIMYSAQVSGQYELSVSTSRGAAIPGCPFPVPVGTAAVAVGRCRAQFESSSNQGCAVVAGSDVAVCISAFDGFGNQVSSLEGEDVEVIPGWPQPLHLLPGSSQAAACQLRGADVGRELTVGRPVEVSLCTIDGFGNARVAGGESVTCALESPAGTALQQATVQDDCTGSYRIAFTPNTLGRWRLLPRVNGEAVRLDGFDMHAVYGPLQAKDCAIDQSSLPSAATCGSVAQLRLCITEAAGPERSFSGSEALMASVIGPSGVRQRLDVVHAGAQRLIAIPVEVAGLHEVHVLLDQQHVIGSPLKLPCHPGPISLATSAFSGPGLMACVAGQPASFAIQACDAWGHRIMEVPDEALAVRASAGDEVVAGTVTATGEGRFSVSYTLTLDGTFEIQVTGGAGLEIRVFTGVCSPAALHLASCRIMHSMTCVAAGEACQMLISPVDRYHNRIAQLPSLASLTAVSAKEADFLNTRFSIAADGSIALECRGQHAGTYAITVTDANSALPDIPLTVTPAPPFPSHSSASWAHDTAKGTLQAGQAAVVDVILRDAFGNHVTAEGWEHVKVAATGPASVQLAACEAGRPGRLTAALTLAGTYIVNAQLEGRLLPGWPKPLSVVACLEGAVTCSLRGEALSGLVVKQRHALFVFVADAFGNPRVAGGEAVAVHLAAADGSTHIVSATDCHDGSYTFKFSVERPGKWTLTPQVNGQLHSKGCVAVEAVYGPLLAEDMTLSWHQTGPVSCGDELTFTVEPAEHEAYGRLASGHEALSVMLMSPSGASCALPVQLSQGRYQGRLTCKEVGRHTLSAALSGHNIKLSPLTIQAQPGRMVLANSCIDAAPLAGLVAGKAVMLELAARDALGNAISSGGEAVQAEVTDVNDKSVEVAVTDKQDGCYTMSFTPTAAGRLQVVVQLAGQAKRLRFGAVCSPAALDAAQSAVAGADCQLVAGQQGTARLARMDRYGNGVPRAAEEPAMSVELAGQGGSGEARLVEMASGLPQISYSATRAGSYSLVVRIDRQPVGEPIAAVGPATVDLLEQSDLTYRGVFVRAGTYTGRACLGGRLLLGWPRQLHVLPACASAIHSHLSGQALQGVICKERCTITLHTADEFGNVSVAGGAAVEAYLAQSEQATRTVQAQVADNHNGTYALSFVLPAAGTWTLRVSVDGVPMSDTGVPLQAAFAPLAVADCQLVPGGPLDPQCGKQQTWYIEILAPSGAVRTVPITLSEHGGRVEASVQWLEVGSHQVAAYLNGVPISGCPVCVGIRPAATHAPSCTISRLTNCSSGRLDLEIATRDAYGNASVLPTGCLEVGIEPAGALADVEVCSADEELHLAGGAALLKLSATIVMDGVLKLAVAGEPICTAGLAFRAAVSANSHIRFVAPASGQLRATAGDALHVLAELVNDEGQRLDQGDMAVEAHLQQAGSSSPVTVSQRGVGLYNLSHALTLAGSFTLSASLRGTQSAPATLTGTCAACATSAAHCTADLSDLKGWQAGRAAALLIARHDRFGNRLFSSGGQPAMVGTAAGPGPAHVTVEEVGDGTVRVSCLARLAGCYTIALEDSVTSQAIAGSPFTADLAAGLLSPQASSYTLQGVSRGPHVCTLQAGQALGVVVDGRDAFGNTAGVVAGAVGVEAHGPQGALPLSPQADIGEACLYSASLTVAGSYTVAVGAVDAEGRQAAIPAADGSRAVKVVPGFVSLQHVVLRDVPTAVVAGMPHTFYVHPVDAFGNAGATGAHFSAEMVSGPASIPCKLATSTAGERITKATILLSVKVEEAACDAGCSYLTGFWPAHGAVAGVPAGFIVQACDALGNPRSRGGDDFSVDIRGVSSEAVTLSDRQDGSYAVQYCIPHEGSFSATAMLGGQHVRGSPSTFTVFRDIAALADQELEKRLSTTLSSLRRGIATARTLHESLRSDAKSLTDFIPVLVEGARTGINDALRQQEALMAETRAAYNREAVERRRLHNVVQELRGNIRVYVRVKPLTAEEGAAGMFSVLRCADDHRIQCTAQGSAKAFDFDRVFGPESRQEEIFEDVSQLVTSALDGYNVCIFAYGQTGAGKTHTMEGSKEQPGINYRAMKELFRSIREERSTDASIAIHVSIVEIYNEVVNDLLCSGGKKEVELQRAAGGFGVPDLTQVEVTSPEQIFEIMGQGFEHRAVGCHDINTHSSRSHCLLIINVAVTEASTSIRTVGKLTLCDLAGSERINKTHATGLTLTEAQNINRSLLELGNVISALMQQSSHVPYRNSKLTMLLQDSLGGDAKALMFCNLSSNQAHAAETLSSLAFASKVANVVLKTPQRKFVEDSDPKETGGTAAQIRADKKCLLVLLGLSGCLAGDNASRKLLQAIPAMCTGTVSTAAKCPTFQNNHDGCNATPGCQAGKFGNNFNTCYTLACGTLTNQAACANVGCSWMPATPGLLKVGAKYAFQSDAGGFMFRCNQCAPQNANGFPDQAFAAAVDHSSPLTHFTIVDAGNGLVALQADGGLFLARCHTCSDAAFQPETATIGISSAALPTSPFAHWKVMDAGNGKVAFQADSGNFLARCHNCYSQELLADSVTVHVPALAGNPWATWTPVAL
ncbi:hypothetical protein WJX72_005680 [[Myrmecia] bisecta]|uniref:Kinesin motor domain-containing protein n=1 Tax=[Myrmecia] bisecta TaxID=41462 RepID=A0AAW1R5Y2_9CHLO